jgi:hypothetical protein
VTWNIEQLVDFVTFIKILFGRSHRDMLWQISGWAEERPTRVLSAKQQRELSDLFQLYDRDNSGLISTAELQHHFTTLGFSREGTSFACSFRCHSTIVLVDMLLGCDLLWV